MRFKTLAERVAYILAEDDISASEAARHVGCSREAISQWANGETKNIRNEWLFRFADFTGYEARWIATGEGPMKRLDKYAVENIQHVVHAMESMSPYWQNVARKLVDDVRNLPPASDPKTGTDP